MTISPTLAAKAYAAAMGQMTRAAGETKPAGAGQSDFSAVLQESLNATATAGSKAETAIVSQVAGKSDVVDVVSAVAEAEIAMKTLVSVRDRMINAYQDIMKMPV